MRPLRLLPGRFLLVCAIASLPSLALADDNDPAGTTDYYAGLDLGQSNYTPLMNAGISSYDSCTAASELTYTQYLVTNSPCSSRPHGRAGRLYGGWQLNDYAALELGYGELGKGHMSSELPGRSIERASVYTNLLDAELVGLLPAGSSGLSLEGRLGLYMAKTSTENDAIIYGPQQQSASNSGVLMGIGARYALNRRVALRLGLEVINQVGNQDTGQGNVYLFSGGVLVHLQ